MEKLYYFDEEIAEKVSLKVLDIFWNKISQIARNLTDA